MKGFWVGIRSCGRPQLISVLTSIYQMKNLFDGLMIVGEVDEVSKMMMEELDRSLYVVHISGNYDLGQATIKLIKGLREQKLSSVLFLDDDVLFMKSDINKLLLKGVFDFDVVSTFQKQDDVSRYWERVWEKSGVVEFYFSLFKGEVLSKFTKEDFDLLKRFKYGGEFYCLTWILKEKGVKTMVFNYPERPVHLFLPSEKSLWRVATLEDWDEYCKDMKKAKNRDEVISVVDNWNSMVEIRNRG